jgi:hypothetical protein
MDDRSRLDVVEIARVPDMLPSLFPLLFGLGTYQHPGITKLQNVATTPDTVQTKFTKHTVPRVPSRHYFAQQVAAFGNAAAGAWFNPNWE